jgi:hypothetical protein
MKHKFVLIIYLAGFITGCSTNHQSTKISPIRTVADIQNGVHGIVMDQSGHLIVATPQQLHKVASDGTVTPFVTLKNVTDTTRIWNMKIGPDGNIYCAAKDCIIRITSKGGQKILAQEKFTGRWGACDLAFDNQGNFYAVHGKIISQFNAQGVRKDVFKHVLDVDSVKNLVGIAFDPKFERIFVSDVFGKQIIQIPFTPNDKNTQAKFNKVDGYPEYFAWSQNDNLVVSSPGKKRSKLFQLQGDQFTQLTFAEGDSIKGLNTITFGKTPFLENAVYGLGHGYLYEMKLGK